MRLDVRLRELATRQHSAVAVAQARDLGATRAQLRRRRASADWDAPTPRVLVLAGSTKTYRQRCMVAVLTQGPAPASPTRGCESLAAAGVLAREG